MAKHFQYKLEVSFKEIILDGPLGKMKYFLFVLSFKKGLFYMSIHLYGFLHVHSFIWFFNTPDIENEAAYIKFID